MDTESDETETFLVVHKVFDYNCREETAVQMQPVVNRATASRILNG
jgi:hypothetical protein